MASYSVSAGAIGAHNKTLVGGTVDTVTFADDADLIEVVSDGAAALYFTLDGSTPTVWGENTYFMPASLSERTEAPGTPGGTVVKLISSGTPTYSVSQV